MRTRSVVASLLGAGFALLLSQPCLAAETPSKAKIAQLIDKLGSGDFSEREQATKELSAIGAPALEALRKAAKSEDAEVRKRAEELLPKIERQADSARILAPKRVRLVYKDTPLPEALADFQKQCGYSMELHDPDGKLKERKITLDTGDTTFWHAFALFCAKAELTETSLAELMQAPRFQQGVFPVPPPAQPVPPAKQPVPGAPAAAPAVPPAAQMVALRPARRAAPAMQVSNSHLLLRDGKPKQLPTDDRSAFRIRALSKSDLSVRTAEGEFLLMLEVSPEPKLQWEVFQSIHIDKAVDDREQKLAQVIPQVEGVGPAGIGGAAGMALPRKMQMQMQMQRQMQMRMQMQMRRMRGIQMLGGSARQQVLVQLKKGAKEAKSLKELKGTITASLLTEAQPMIVADKLKEGESFKGKEGGFIKIMDVKSAEEETTIRFEFEQPSLDKVTPAQPNVMQGFVVGNAAPAVIQFAPAVQKMPVPPIAMKGALAVKFGAGPFMDSFNGLSVLDDKGKTLPMQVQAENRFQQQAGGAFKHTTIYTFTCRREKDKGQPVKVVFLGRKPATVDVPFVLRDVPLP